MDYLGFFKIHAINLRLFDFSGHTLFFKINFKISCYLSRSSLGLFGSQFFTWEGNRWEEECLGKMGHLGSLEAFNRTSWKSVTHPVVHAVENICSFRNMGTFIALEISGYHSKYFQKYLDIMQHIDISPRKASRAVKPGPSDCCGDLHFTKMMILVKMGMGIMMKIVRELKKYFLIDRVFQNLSQLEKVSLWDNLFEAELRDCALEEFSQNLSIKPFMPAVTIVYCKWKQ